MLIHSWLRCFCWFLISWYVIWYQRTLLAGFGWYFVPYIKPKHWLLILKLYQHGTTIHIMDISNNSTGSKESFFYKILWRIRTALSCIPESPALINNYHCLLNVLIHPIFFRTSTFTKSYFVEVDLFCADLFHLYN